MTVPSVLVLACLPQRRVHWTIFDTCAISSAPMLKFNPTIDFAPWTKINHLFVNHPHSLYLVQRLNGQYNLTDHTCSLGFTVQIYTS